MSIFYKLILYFEAIFMKFIKLIEKSSSERGSMGAVRSIVAITVGPIFAIIFASLYYFGIIGFLISIFAIFGIATTILIIKDKKKIKKVFKIEDKTSVTDETDKSNILK